MHDESVKTKIVAAINAVVKVEFLIAITLSKLPLKE
jgi:hypothetical protein